MPVDEDAVAAGTTIASWTEGIAASATSTAQYNVLNVGGTSGEDQPVTTRAAAAVDVAAAVGTASTAAQLLRWLCRADVSVRAATPATTASGRAVPALAALATGRTTATATGAAAGTLANAY